MFKTRGCYGNCELKIRFLKQFVCPEHVESATFKLMFDLAVIGNSYVV